MIHDFNDAPDDTLDLHGMVGAEAGDRADSGGYHVRLTR